MQKQQSARWASVGPPKVFQLGCTLCCTRTTKVHRARRFPAAQHRCLPLRLACMHLRQPSFPVSFMTAIASLHHPSAPYILCMYALAKQSTCCCFSCKCVLFSMAFQDSLLLVHCLFFFYFVLSFLAPRSHQFLFGCYASEPDGWVRGGWGNLRTTRIASRSARRDDVRLVLATNNGPIVCHRHKAIRHAAVPAAPPWANDLPGNGR